MYFKCAECGHIFEEGEVYEVYEDPSGGDYPVCVEQSCPKCRGAYEEAVRCADCGGLFLKDELLAGLCKDCFKEAINYSTLLVFADYEPDEPDETNILQSFIAEVVPALSDSSRRNCRKLYLRIRLFRDFYKMKRTRETVRNIGLVHFRKINR